MINRRQIAIAAMMAAITLPAASLNAQDTGKYPDFSGQWKRPPGAGIQWDQTKRPGLTQQAPLIPEYQKIFEASIADQALGGQGECVARYVWLEGGQPCRILHLWIRRRQDACSCPSRNLQWDRLPLDPERQQLQDRSRT